MVMEASNIAFYKFVPISDPQELCEKISKGLKNLGIKGTLLIAPEGINGMLAGTKKSIEGWMQDLKSDSRFSDILVKASYSKKIPFRNLKVKVKEEVLTLGMPEIVPFKENIPYIEPTVLKKALDRGEKLILIDIRNDFEVNFGTFKGAINPRTKSFSEFPEFAKKLDLERSARIVTFCTGGIRCEKGAIVLRRAGFENVSQLEGGILGYFSANNGAPHFLGKCFVFDERELLDGSLKPERQ